MYPPTHVDNNTIIALAVTAVYMMAFLIIANDAVERLDETNHRRIFVVSLAMLLVCVISSSAIFVLIKTGAV